MSKAFTSEETPDDPVLGRPVQRAARGQERPMTPEGYRALMSERERLTGAMTASGDRRRRPEGDSGERIEADELKHRLALVNATLDSVRVVTPPPVDGVVRFGSTVTLEWDDGRVQEIRIVGVDEAQGQNISVESPLARTLLEQKEGDEVEVVRPRGVATARLVRVA